MKYNTGGRVFLVCWIYASHSQLLCLPNHQNTVLGIVFTDLPQLPASAQQFSEIWYSSIQSLIWVISTETMQRHGEKNSQHLEQINQCLDLG